MSKKSSLSPVDVRRAIDAKQTAKPISGRTVKAGLRNFGGVEHYGKSPLEMLIAIEERNLALMRRLDLTELASTMNVESCLAQLRDTPRETELPERLRKLLDSQAWNTIEGNAVGCLLSDSRMHLANAKQDASEMKSLASLPLRELRRKVSLPKQVSNLEAGIVNTVRPSVDIEITAEPEFLAQFDSPKLPEKSAVSTLKRKQTVRKTLIRKLRFIAHREQHHIQSVRRVDGTMMVRYWTPIFATPQRTKRKASRMRFSAPVCTHYVVHSVSLRQYLAIYDDVADRGWIEQPQARPVAGKFTTMSYVDVDRRVVPQSELFAGESTSETIHTAMPWYGKGKR